MSVTVTLARRPCVIKADGSPGDQCRIAPTVSDSLIVSDAVALARAEAILDRNGHKWKTASLSCPLDVNMEPGNLLDVLDSENGRVTGKIVSIANTVAISDDGKSFTADSAITVRRLRDE